MYQNYLHLIANVCVTVSNILSKEIIHNNTIFEVPLNSTESLKRRFYKTATREILPIVYMVLVSFKIHFLGSDKKLLFVLSRIITSLTFKKCRK